MASLLSQQTNCTTHNGTAVSAYHIICAKDGGGTFNSKVLQTNTATTSLNKHLSLKKKKQNKQHNATLATSRCKK